MDGKDKRQVDASKEAIPPYQFYARGITQPDAAWLAAMLGFLKDKGGGDLASVVSLLVLGRIACEAIRRLGQGPNGMLLAACIIAALMIFTIGLLAILRATKEHNVKSAKEDKGRAIEPESGAADSHEDGGAQR